MRLAVLSVLALTPALALAAPAKAAKGPATPRACWEALDKAARDNDQGRFWDLLSTRSRTEVEKRLKKLQLGMLAKIRQSPDYATKPVTPDGKLLMGEAVKLSPREFFVRGTAGQPRAPGPKKTAFVYERIKGERAEVAWDEDGKRIRANFVREGGVWRYDELPER